MKSAITIASLTLLALVSGCASATHYPVETAGQVKRVITCTVKPDADPVAVLRVANDLTNISGVLDVSAGYASSPITQSVAGRDRVVTFIVTLRDDMALGSIGSDRAFQHARDDLLSPLCSKIEIADVTLQNYQVSEKFTAETTAADLQRRAAAIQKQNELRGQTK